MTLVNLIFANVVSVGQLIDCEDHIWNDLSCVEGNSIALNSYVIKKTIEKTGRIRYNSLHLRSTQ